MYAAVDHLITEHGYRRIAFIQGSENSQEAKIRYRAYTDALTENAIAFDPMLVAPGNFRPPAGEDAVRLFVDKRQLRPGRDFEAIVAANDSMAFTALEVLQARGFTVPHDVAVIGFDDTEEARSATPPLTTVRLSSYELGYQAISLVVAQIREKAASEQVTIPTRLIVRQSCGIRRSCRRLPGPWQHKERLLKQPLPGGETRLWQK
jgi:DNA-binding LacI/PurR family transcriptional regulator